MPKRTDLSTRDRLFILLLASPFVLAGLYVIALGMHWIPSDPARMHAPGWVIALCGLIFFSGGLVILSFAWRSDSQPMKVFLVAMVVGIAIVTHWVAFGSGERLFTLTRTVNGVVVESGPIDERTGRRIFGAAAAVFDLALVAMALVRVRKRLS